MKAQTKIDKCYSTTTNSVFNFDKVARETISDELCRGAFDFSIEKRKCYDENGREIPEIRHLQDNEGNFIPCHGVTDTFTPVQHIDVYNYIHNEILPSIPNATVELAGTIRGRSTGLFALKVGDAFSIKGDESPNNMRLFFCNPSNGTGTMRMGFTTVRVVCENTLLAAVKQVKNDGFSIRHTEGAVARVDTALNCIYKQFKAAEEIKRRSEILAGYKVDGETVEKCLNAVYPLFNIPEDSRAYSRLNNLRTEVLRQFESGETAQSMTTEGRHSAWALFNAFTYPIFNPNEVRLSKRTTADKAEIGYLGMNGRVGDKVRDIFEKVERIAQVA